MNFRRKKKVKSASRRLENKSSRRLRVEALEQRRLLTVGLSTLDLSAVLEDAGPQLVGGFATYNSSGAPLTLHDEGANGTLDPLSRNSAAPTQLGELAVGSNLVSGHLEAALTVGDVDIFTFTVSPGTQLDSLFVREFSNVSSAANDSTGFLAINDAGTFPLTTAELNGGGNTDLFLGGTLFGAADVSSPGSNGNDLLAQAGTFAGRGFTAPLGPGTYTIYAQQTGPATQYTLDFNVSSDGSGALETLHDEGANGALDPLSRNSAAPTQLGELGVGSNLVNGHLEAALTVGDVDIFSFTVSPGTQLDSLFVQDFSNVSSTANDSTGFLGINDAGTFPLTTAELNGGGNTDLFLGGTLFGAADLPSQGSNGTDLLARAGTFAGRGFTAPLGPGTYTVYVQQTGPATQYTLDFEVSSDGSGSDSDSSRQVVGFLADNVSNPTLFSAAPSIDSNGNLTYTPAPNAFGTSTFEVRAQLNDGSGLVTSEPRTTTITVTSVNDPPIVTTLGDLNAIEDSGPQTITQFVTAIDPGINETAVFDQSRVAFDEGDFGTDNPISIDNLNPTQLGTLTPGSNLISGFLETAFITGRVDVLTFEIPAGFEWSGLFVNEFEYLTDPGNDRAGFLAINDADFFPFDTDDLNINISPPVDESLFLGGTTFGLDNLPSAGGGNILPNAGQFAGRGFSSPLPAGTYTIYTQQNGPSNRYTLDVQVTAVEPQAIVDLAVGDVSNPELFSSPPQLDAQGNLSFEPAADAFGISTFEVIAQDNGGTANGGVDQSATTITLAINGVNDAPSFTASNPPVVAPGSGAQVVPNFASFVAGVSNESSQSALEYFVTGVSDPSAFTSLPSISSNGDLSYTLAPDAFGIFQFDVSVQDDGGTASGGQDTSATQTFQLISEDTSVPRDFGDAPPGYPVLLQDNGARHGISTLFLGSGVTAELDGSTSTLATGDEDDGVTLLTSPVTSDTFSTTSQLQVTASESGLLNIWIDFNQDGDWDDPGEQVATDVPVVAGQQFVNYSVPAGAIPGVTVGRFRISTQAGLAPTGPAIDGEVEDHLIEVRDPSTPTDIFVALRETSLLVTQRDDQFVIGDSSGAFWSAPVISASAIDLRGNATDDVVVLDQDSANSGALPTLNFDGAEGFDQLQVRGYTQPIDVTANGNAVLSNLEQIDINDGVDSVVRVDTTSIADLNSDQTLLLRGNRGDTIEFADSSQWRLGETGFVDGVFIRDVVAQDTGARIRADIESYWLNVLDANDVNNDGLFSALDVLVIINELNSRSLADATTGALPRPEELPVWPGVYYDRTGDGLVAENDVFRAFDELGELDQASQSQSNTGSALSLSESVSALSTGSLPASTGLTSVSAAEAASPTVESVEIQGSAFLNSQSSEDNTDEAMEEEIDWRLG